MNEWIIAQPWACKVIVVSLKELSARRWVKTETGFTFLPPCFCDVGEIPTIYSNWRETISSEVFTRPLLNSLSGDYTTPLDLNVNYFSSVQSVVVVTEVITWGFFSVLIVSALLVLVWLLLYLTPNEWTFHSSVCTTSPVSEPNGLVNTAASEKMCTAQSAIIKAQLFFCFYKHTNSKKAVKPECFYKKVNWKWDCSLSFCFWL